MKLNDFSRNAFVMLSGVPMGIVAGNMPTLYGTIPVQKATLFDWILTIFGWIILPLAVIIAIIFGIIALVKKRKHNDKKDTQSGPTQNMDKL